MAQIVALRPASALGFLVVELLLGEDGDSRGDGGNQRGERLQPTVVAVAEQGEQIQRGEIRAERGNAGPERKMIAHAGQYRPSDGRNRAG